MLAGAPSGSGWAALAPAEKRERLLAAAARVFADEGLDAPVPAIARAAGAGVGSVYRVFASKDELVAALAVRHLAALEVELARAEEQPDAWAALRALIWRVLGEGAKDDVGSKAIASASASPEVAAARERVGGRIDDLLARARADGAVREDATRLDVTLVIVAARAVRDVHPDAWRRLVEVALDGLSGPVNQKGTVPS